MRVPLKWLKDYVDIEMGAKEFADLMTMSGSKVEAIEALGEGIKGVVTGRIESIVPHPNADKLVITQVNIGTETLQIVTGAKNVKEGDVVPLALEGAELAGGLKIKKGKLRGEVSQGMLCSQEELGIPVDYIPQDIRDGIWILDKDLPLGVPLQEVVDFRDQIIEFEITSNRPDCLSVIGLAREAAATLGKSMKSLEVEPETQADTPEGITVTLEDTDGCHRYVARVIKDVVVAPSPLWLQERLLKAGVRPINNVVDITNYVMLEYGQPLHAFDLTHIAGKQIIVRKAQNQEAFTTLDSVQRTLDHTMTVIADGEKALAVAGVMGGENSEVTLKTRTVLLESASFNKDRVRATSKKLGLRTEASSRFEKGVDTNLAITAANRACQLMAQLGVGKVSTEIVDVYPVKKEPRVVLVRPERINQLLGTTLTPEEMVDILARLEIPAVVTPAGIEATVPTFRDDLQMEADFAEEISRLYGYNNIPSTMLRGKVTVGGKNRTQSIEDRTRTILCALGYHEVLTYSFVSPKSIDKINLGEESIKRKFVKLLNPLGDETSVMRTSLLPNMMQVLAHNQNHRVEEAKAFELGSIFIPHPNPEEKLPQEISSLVIGAYGEEDFYSVKGAVETLLQSLGITGSVFEVEKNHPTFHPGRCANLFAGEKLLGTLGEIHPQVMENYDMYKKCYAAELDFAALVELTNLQRMYQPLPKYPAMTRDLAIVVKDEIFVRDIERILEANGGAILEKFELFDVYKGSQVPAGYKSVAYTLTYRHGERTLQEEEVNQVQEKIIAELKEKLGGQLRE